MWSIVERVEWASLSKVCSSIVPCSFSLVVPPRSAFEVEGRVPIAASIWSRPSLKMSVHLERDGKYTEKMKRGDGEVFSSTWWFDIIGVGLVRWSSLVCHPRATPPWPLNRCGVQKMGMFFARWTDSLEFIVRVQRLDGMCAVIMEPVLGKGNQ